MHFLNKELLSGGLRNNDDSQFDSNSGLFFALAIILKLLTGRFILGKFTEFSMFPVSRNNETWFTTIFAQFSSDSGVEAPKWGIGIILSTLPWI